MFFLCTSLLMCFSAISVYTTLSHTHNCSCVCVQSWCCSQGGGPRGGGGCHSAIVPQVSGHGAHHDSWGLWSNARWGCGTQWANPGALQCTVLVCHVHEGARNAHVHHTERRSDWASGTQKRRETWSRQPGQEGEWAATTVKRSHNNQRGHNTTRNNCHSGCQKVLTRHSTQREERVTCPGPVKKPQPDKMSHGGAVPGQLSGSG